MFTFSLRVNNHSLFCEAIVIQVCA